MSSESVEAAQGLMCAMLDSVRIDGKQKMKLLSGLGSNDAGTPSLQERVDSQYYQEVLQSYLEYKGNKIDHKLKAKLESHATAKQSKEKNAPETPSYKLGTTKVEIDNRPKFVKDRESSLISMLTELNEHAKERKQALQSVKRQIVAAEKARSCSAFLVALRHGRKDVVAGYISTLAEFRDMKDEQFKPLELLLAKDADGNPAFFNAMENDEDGAIAAYIEAVLSSPWAWEDKRDLLRAEGRDKLTALQAAMGSGQYRAMNAYVRAVLACAHAADDQKQDLLTAIGKGGKTARQIAVNPGPRSPGHPQLVRLFDSLVQDSKLPDLYKKVIQLPAPNDPDYGNKKS
jgi:hypothetical protein